MKTVHLFNPNLTVAPSPVTGRSGRTIWPTLAIGRRFTMPFPDYEKLKLELCCGSGTKDGRWVVENVSDDAAPTQEPKVAEENQAVIEEHADMLALMEPHAIDADDTVLDTLKRVLEAPTFGNTPDTLGQEAQPLVPKSRPGATISERLDELNALIPAQLKELGKAMSLRVIGVSKDKLITAIIAAEATAAPVTPHA